LHLTKETRGEFYGMLLEPPEPPFAVYVTRGGQKQGHIGLINYVSFSRGRYYIGSDWQDRPFIVSQDELLGFDPLIRFLREEKVSKEALRTGGFTMKQWERAMKGGYEDKLRAAQGNAGSFAWEVMVHVAV
jgi:hypothetical protein